jgi:hypothetical protein
MALLGIVVGAIASLAVSYLIAALLFAAAPTDPQPSPSSLCFSLP